MKDSSAVQQTNLGQRFYARVLREANISMDANGLFNQASDLVVRHKLIEQLDRKSLMNEENLKLNKETQVLCDKFAQLSNQIMMNNPIKDTTTKTAFSMFPQLACMLFQISSITGGMGLGFFAKNTLPSLSEMTNLGNSFEQKILQLQNRSESLSINPDMVQSSLESRMSEFEKVLNYDNLNQLEKNALVSQTSFLASNPNLLGLNNIGVNELEALFSQPGLFEDAIKLVTSTPIAVPVAQSGMALIKGFCALLSVLEEIEFNPSQKKKNRPSDSWLIDSFNSYGSYSTKY